MGACNCQIDPPVTIIVQNGKGATILAAIILDEQPTALEFIGSLVVLAGVYLALRPASRETPAPEYSAADG